MSIPTQSDTTPSSGIQGFPALWVRLAAIAALGPLAVLYPKLSFPAAMLCLIGGLSLPRLEGRARTLGRAALVVGGLGAALGVGRFVLLEALPGVVAGGSAAVEKHAVATLRSIVVAEDYARRSALLDPDEDGVGSALSLRELAGYAPVGPKFPQETPPLAFPSTDLLDTRAGEAWRKSGYLFQLCLPVSADHFAARRQDDISAELAERRYLVYAWPEQGGKGRPSTVYFADEHERILQLENSDGQYVGVSQPPPCTAALDQPGWLPWKGKLPRTHLVGEHPKASD